MGKLMQNNKIMNWAILICLSTLVLSVIIYQFMVFNFYIALIFRMIFVVISCVFLGCAPFNWMPFIARHFSFLMCPVWRSGFIILLGCQFFPGFQGVQWAYWYQIFRHITALVTIGLGLIEFAVEIVDCQNGRFESYEREVFFPQMNQNTM
ncbi:Hypothetical_protein [Hexamita inflata]|uniref:Hypothetical_protein n=1 Tax=Hexamita inflata TaxID=28002 RepID=A0AA86R4J5_9EUKA|nr:Hypothetical protein HINF_LOCUS56892 [Hexamita inflata]